MIKDCSFKVKEFDMLAGMDVYWWSMKAPNFGNLTEGFKVSDPKLNQTYKKPLSLSVCLIILPGIESPCLPFGACTLRPVLDT